MRLHTRLAMNPIVCLVLCGGAHASTLRLVTTCMFDDCEFRIMPLSINI